MEYPLSSIEVSRLLGVNPSRLGRAVWAGRIPQPLRTHSGAFIWREDDVRRACWVLLHRDLDGIVAERQEVTRD